MKSLLDCDAREGVKYEEPFEVVKEGLFEQIRSSWMKEKGGWLD